MLLAIANVTVLGILSSIWTRKTVLDTIIKVTLFFLALANASVIYRAI